MPVVPPNALFSAFSFVGFLLCVIPLYWYCIPPAWNLGIVLYIIWTGLGCLNVFINSVVWNHSVADVAPVWCDISTRFTVGVVVGIPAALLVISRRLYKTAKRTTTFLTTAEQRRDICVDLAIGLGIPILQMALEIIVEGHRFDIFEDVGCYPNTYNVPPAFPLVYIWPLSITVITVVYSCLNIRFFWKSSRQLKEILVGQNGNSSQDPYLRFIAFCSTQILFSLPITIYPIYFNARVIPIFPWLSWDDTHFDYSFVGQVPSVVWHAHINNVVALELHRWFLVLCAFLFFIFFGGVSKHFRLAYSFVRSRLWLPKSGSSRASSSSPNSPASAFGLGFKKGMGTLFSFKDGFSVLGRCGKRGVVDEPKAVEFQPAPVPQDVEVALPEMLRASVQPPPIAKATPISPGKLGGSPSHSPTSIYFDASEDVV